MSLNPKQQRFVEEYVKDFNATQAAIRSGYSQKTAGQIGEENLRKPEIKEAVEALKKKASDANEVTVARVLQGILRVAELDPRKAYDSKGDLLPIHKLPDEVAFAISGIDTEEIYEYERGTRKNIGKVRKLKFSSRDRALELLGRYLAMFLDRAELTGKNGKPLIPSASSEHVKILGQLTDEQLDALGDKIKTILRKPREDVPAPKAKSGKTKTS
jgi:phage terminase small subunit